MKNKLKLVLIIPLLFLTGCSINYDLRIDSNLKFKEKATILENNSILELYSQNLKLVPEQKFSQYEDTNYKLIEKIFESDKTGGIVTANFKDYNDFEKSILFTNLFSDLNINEYGNIVTMQTSGYNSSFFISEIDPTLNVEDITVNIRFHNKVVENNADRYDEKTNTYTWILDADPTSGNVMFSIDKNQKRYDIIFKDFITDNSFTIISTIVIGLSGLLIYLYFRNKNRVMNKI